MTLLPLGEEEGLRVGGLVEGRQLVLVQVELDAVEMLAFRHLDLRLGAQARLVGLAGLRLGQPHGEAVGADVERDLVLGELLAAARPWPARAGGGCAAGSRGSARR